MFIEGKSRTVFLLQTLLFIEFLVTAQKIITYALVSTIPKVRMGARATINVALMDGWYDDRMDGNL